jgi:hypothetical protein
MGDGCQAKFWFDSSLKRNMSQEQVYPPSLWRAYPPVFLEDLTPLGSNSRDVWYKKMRIVLAT